VNIENEPRCQAPVAHASNPCYSGGRDQEDCSSKPAQANSSKDPILKKPITKKGLVEWLKVLQYCKKENKPCCTWGVPTLGASAHKFSLISPLVSVPKELTSLIPAFLP
jgi:hypothetical protein